MTETGLPEPTTWNSVGDNDGMRFPEESDLTGGETDMTETGLPEEPAFVKGLRGYGDPFLDAHECQTIIEYIDALRRAAQELEQRAEAAEAQVKNFCMDYRMKCDEETKRLHVALEEAEERERAAREDAERYLYWRDNHGWTGYFDDGLTNSNAPGDVDAAIDAALRAGGKA